MAVVSVSARAAWLAIALAAATLLAGCATAPSAVSPGRGRGPPLRAAERVCAPSAAGGGQVAAAIGAPLPPEQARAAADELAAQGYSRTAIGIAEVIGALEPLRRLAAL